MTKENIYARNGTTESEFINIVDQVCKQLAKEFVFGSYQYRDICQQAYVEALKALHKTEGVCYDVSRPLDDFLFVHIRNRLNNFRRNKFNKQKKPCKTCPLFDKKCERSENQCEGYENRLDCEKYADWYFYNKRKMELNSASGYPESHTDEPPMKEEDRGELLALLDKRLSSDLRSDFLKILGGVSISHKRRAEIRLAVKTIIVESGEYPEFDSFWEKLDEL